MIEGYCSCGKRFGIAESTVNRPFLCETCRVCVRTVSAETLADGAGAGDFDAQLVVIQGPDRVGERILLGGCLDIEIGKLEGKHIHLPHHLVSRFHAKLVRLDFGPSRWKIEDNRSTNGVFVNGAKVECNELFSGDTITIGGYGLAYTVVAAAAPPLAAVAGALPPVANVAALPVRAQAAPVATVAAAAPIVSYADRGQDGTQLRPLHECDADWVVRLRVASILLLLTLVINLFVLVANMMNRGHKAQAPLVATIIAAVVAGVAAWLLTSPEPMGANDYKYSISGILLRIAATAAAAGETGAAVGVLMDNIPIKTAGTIISIASIPQTFLLLFYIRKLALRIPNEWLAVNCIIVMIGLPGALGLSIGGALYAMWLGNFGVGFIGSGVGVCSLVVFCFWYIILLIWFQSALDY
jgi:hypothetical protein